jgi:membrane-bound metal-dependent hydrolase YbcI (DUF457 family)
MFIGHFAVGFASKRVAPRASLGWLLTAPLVCDLLWPIFLLTKIESVRIDPGNTAFTPLDLHDYPWSHSLAMSLVWSLVFGGAYFLAQKDGRGALVVGAGVFSHFVLDWVTHRPDMPLYPGSATSVGLGLWNSIPGTVVVEVLMFGPAVWLYARTTKAKNKKGTIAFWALVGFLAFAYVVNMIAPPPPSETALAWGALLSWIFVPWAVWIDRNRELRVTA